MRFIEDESGQATTEYGAMLAFAAIIIALVFSVTSSSLKLAISNAFSSAISELSLLQVQSS